MRAELRIWGLPGIKEIVCGDRLGELIVQAALCSGEPLQAGDVVVVAQKAVSKAEGRLVELARVEPSELALGWARQWGRDARLVECILRESRRIVRMEGGRLIVETRHGWICANAGVDTSNVEAGWVALLPLDPDASARRIAGEIQSHCGISLGVIVSDTFGRPWREGLVNVAIGLANLKPLQDYRGQVDANGRELRSTVIAAADEIAGAAELLMGKSLQIPVVALRGLQLQEGMGDARQLIRPPAQDLFR